MDQSMRIAVASGKGGTGKTTVATSLAVALSRAGHPVAYVDCDVEEPNGHIFLNPTIEERHDVTIPVPEVDASKCTLCGACGAVCRYSAILVLPQEVLTFPNLCHGCGGCSLACNDGAITEVPRVTGVVEKGASGPVTYVAGKLGIGEAMAPPVIRGVIDAAPRDGIMVLDAPPGTSCPVIESVKSADVVALVTEPTPFGLNDLKLAVGMVRELGIPFGVVVNRVGVGDDAVFDYCSKERIPILLTIPDDRAIAQAYSRGELAIEAVPELRARFEALYNDLVTLSRTPRVSRPAQRDWLFADRARTGDALISDPSQPGPRGDVKELVVISGKGGTGKTSVVSSFFALAEQGAVADCDVDAADLHLILEPKVLRSGPFSGSNKAVIDTDLCTQCGLCVEHCRFDAIYDQEVDGTTALVVDTIACDGCGVCVDVCPEQAASLVPAASGEWFVSETRHGPMAHARLGIAEENSGKLVALVRREGKAVAVEADRNLLISDASPGVGCPVISSISGANLVLVVTEPTLSGIHDLERVVALCKQFKIKAGVCINKADINPELADRIEADAARQGVPVFGRIRYDEAVTRAHVQKRSVVEAGDSPAAQDIRALWERVKLEMQ